MTSRVGEGKNGFSGRIAGNGWMERRRAGSSLGATKLISLTFLGGGRDNKGLRSNLDQAAKIKETWRKEIARNCVLADGEDCGVNGQVIWAFI